MSTLIVREAESATCDAAIARFQRGLEEALPQRADSADVRPAYG
jgi:hypothetical protein